MTIANDIIAGHMPDFSFYKQQGESLDDIDEYGFTPLIESAIARQKDIAEALLEQKVNVNKPDVTGRSALHWACDNNDVELARLLLKHGADPNAYTNTGLSILVYPVLRGCDPIKHLLYQYDAKLDFALDFINGKLIGHRFELRGDMDIVNTKSEFVELDYEGFILEFTVAIINDSLRRFIASYATKHLRQYFPFILKMMDAFTHASQLLQYQQRPKLSQKEWTEIESLIRSPLVILPAASRGHALCFIRYHEWWAKIDRGENSLKEGSVNLYKITRPEAFNLSFIKQFLYKKQSRRYFHQLINQELGLVPYEKIPLSSQIAGNCSWANVQAVVPVAFALMSLKDNGSFSVEESLALYAAWTEWDKDRALDECIQRFYLANPLRKASLCSMLAAVLFQACDYQDPHHVQRAEKILTVLTLPDYYYILESYLQEFCVKRLTKRGNNLLKILDDCGIDPQIGVSAVAT